MVEVRTLPSTSTHPPAGQLDRDEVPRSDETDSGDEKPELPFSKARCIALVATVTGAAFLNTLSVQAVVIILPTIGAELSVPESRLQWVVSAYALTFGCFLLLWGRIADIYGKRLIFVAGTAWVAATTAANPFVGNEIAFDLFRGLQGLGAAANVPTAIGILGVTFPPGKAKNYAFSAYAAGAPLGAIFGNLLSGFIAEFTSWKWVFGVMAIMAAFITLAGIFLIPPPHERAIAAMRLHGRAPVDWIGAALVTLGLLALMFALTEGNVVGWATPWVPVLIVVSIGIITAFVFWQLRLEKKGGCPPLVKMSMFANKKFSAAMIIMALFFAAFNNFLVFATIFFQDFQGHSPLQTTLRFLPTGIAGAFIAFVVAHLLSRVPTFYILIVGNVATTLACLLFAVPIPPTTSYFAYGLPAMVLSVLGADTTWPALTLFTSACLSDNDQAVGGALINAVGQFGRAIGLAVATAVQAAVMARERGVGVDEGGNVEEWDDASLVGLRAASWLSTGLGAGALLVVVVAFRSKEVLGGKKVMRSAGEEGVMNEENVDREKGGR